MKFKQSAVHSIVFFVLFFCCSLKVILRPDSIELLFLRSFPDPFQTVERDKKIKIKGKRDINCMKIQ